MLKNEDYELLKENLSHYQRLFEKLNRVADQFTAIEYDESGFCFEEEETLNRHWLKLTTKIVEGLGEALKNYTIEFQKNKGLDERGLTLLFSLEDNKSEVYIDYSEGASLSISQIS